MATLLQKINHIRAKSHPQADCELAVKANSLLCDALYRLSFTADKLSGAEIDRLASQLRNHEDEVIVMLGRIIYLKKHGFSPNLFQDITT